MSRADSSSQEDRAVEIFRFALENVVGQGQEGPCEEAERPEGDQRTELVEP